MPHIHDCCICGYEYDMSEGIDCPMCWDRDFCEACDASVYFVESDGKRYCKVCGKEINYD